MEPESVHVPSLSDVHNDLLSQLTPVKGQVTTHEERGVLQTVQEDDAGLVASAGHPAAPPRAYIHHTRNKHVAADMRHYPTIHMEDGYGYSESGNVDELMLSALREERKALRRRLTSETVDDDRTAVQRAKDWLILTAARLSAAASEWRASGALPRERCPVHAFAQHPTSGKFALAFEHGLEIHSVGGKQRHQIIYKKQTGEWRMNDVRAVAWCPGTVSKLAVGCREGVMVWDIGQKGCIANSGPDVRRLVWSGPTVATLREFAGEPSHTLAWHPSGYLLASGCASSGTISVWDTSRGVRTPIAALSARGSTQLLKWSPAPGDRLLQTTTNGVVRVWETRTWTYQQFRAKGVCRAACWSYSGEVLLLAIDGESIIYSIQVRDRDPDADPTGYEMHAVFDTRACMVTNPRTGEDTVVGGHIRDLAWDDTNSRLAVSFKSDDESPSDSALVAVFNTHMRYSSAHPDLTFGGFVRGPSSTKPAIIAFEAGCSATNAARSLSAVLIVGWLWEEPPEEDDVEASEKRFQQCTFQFLPFYFALESPFILR